MASKEQIARSIMAITSVYPYFAKDMDKSLVADVWNSLLSDYSDELVGYGLKECLKTLSLPPTPADIIKAINDKFAPNKMEKWAELQKALRICEREQQRFTYTFVEDNGLTQGENARRKVASTFDNLPSDLKRYIGSQGELMRMSMRMDYESLEFEKNRFIKSFEPVVTTQDIKNRLEEFKQKELKE